MARERIYRQVFSADELDVVAWKADAVRAGMSFSAWVRQALRLAAKREQERLGAQVPDGRMPRQQEPSVQVPVRTVTTAGVGRLGEVSSGEFERDRERARMLAERDGRCTADVARGSRCKLCGKVHSS